MLWTDDQYTLYEYDLLMLKALKPNGVLSTDRPSPLTREQIVPVFEKIAKHPNYKNHLVICHDKNFDAVILRDGAVME